ncbi:glycosyltransferase family 4 protein [Halalkalicoccus subterraneus]|uniref:glycosyltransferase family 4 protein n=1 Tax=Halalkalicoccus subterraneus TaxID=2675002 RepID=UPI000EFBA6E3|nr:glycosyltransferase family 4 protein [Halalkalicoccus subterraneus]
MKLLRIAQKCYPDVKGGGPYHVHALSRDQAARGHDVTVLTVDHTDRPRRERRDGYTVVRRSPTASLLGNDISTGIARELATLDSYDVLHAHSHLYFSTNLAALRRAVGGPPLAITNHGLYSQNAPQQLFEWYLRTAGRWTFDRADTVFCYTDTERTRLRELGVRTPIEVIPNGIDTDRFRPAGERSEHIAPGPAVLFVGRLVDGKRPQDALDAVAQLRARYPDVHLYFCGDGPLREELEASVTERGLTGAVTFLGQRPYDEMPAIYRAADALVLPSRAEGVPRTVLEAMASGLPVVTSDLEQITSIVEAGGYTAPIGETGKLAERLATALEERPDGREYVEREHRWETTVEATTRALERLAD